MGWLLLAHIHNSGIGRVVHAGALVAYCNAVRSGGGQNKFTSPP